MSLNITLTAQSLSVKSGYHDSEVSLDGVDLGSLSKRDFEELVDEVWKIGEDVVKERCIDANILDELSEEVIIAYLEKNYGPLIDYVPESDLKAWAREQQINKLI